MSKLARLAFALLLLFVASGFAGLIYQSVWSHYLGLTLGHAAYAQTLVLAMFMGGMALGAWLASRYTPKWRRLILGYAAIEAAIGLMGLLFHPAFVGYTGLSQDAVLPAISSSGIAHLWQWSTAALLIAPQSILLGATFPLMSAGLMRSLPQQEGEILGGLYFTNSFGAALGALAATFLLIPAAGLPGTVMTAGILNIAVAIGAWALSKALAESEQVTSLARERSESGVEPEGLKRLGRVLMVSTAISGAASFVYEIGWVRMLNQALGTTVHSFELMLAAFILGLAFGGLWIRKRAQRIGDAVRYVGYVQIAMGLAALLSIPVFAQSFTWVGWIMSALARSDNGYTLFELGTAGIALLVMFPAAFLAGMTLPLFTLAWLRAGGGERVVGRIYAANTLGAIVGVALAMHLLIPMVGVRLSVTLAALADAVLGLYLIRALGEDLPVKRFVGGLVATVAVLGVSMVYGQPDPLTQSSGVYRTGISRYQDGKVEYLRDGKTATVSVLKVGRIMTISTNGKPDAGLTALGDKPTGDELTMVLAGIVPLKLHPHPERVAVIGWGSGLTTHTLLGSPVPKTVDTIEIEPVMHEAARLFGERVERAYNDPRSKLVVDDARTYFSTGARKYDVIVSEPSNPWVSGVASLFTKEFYSFLKRHLERDGMLVQWLHTYELTDPLVATMLSAMVEEFPDSEVYITNSTDLLIVARMGRGRGVRKDWNPQPALGYELERLGLSRPDDLAIRRIGGRPVIETFARRYGVQSHSDFFPTVSLQAPQARFTRAESMLLQNLVSNGMPVLDILECRKPVGRVADISGNDPGFYAQWRLAALQIVDTLSGARLTPGSTLIPDDQRTLLALLALSSNKAKNPENVRLFMKAIARVARTTIGLLPSEDLQSTWIAPSWLTPEVRIVPEIDKVMAAYAAAAQRDPARMRTAAMDVMMVSDDLIPIDVKEQMVVIAMLGALGENDPAGAVGIYRQFPGYRSQDFDDMRDYLAVWAASGVPACAAMRPTAPVAVAR